jgi:hypothetical protein
MSKTSKHEQRLDARPYLTLMTLMNTRYNLSLVIPVVNYRTTKSTETG